MVLARSQPTRGAPGGGRGDGGRGGRFGDGHGRGMARGAGRGAGRGASGPRHHVDTSAAPGEAAAAPALPAKAALAFMPRAVRPGIGAVSSNADFKAKLMASKAQPPQQQ